MGRWFPVCVTTRAYLKYQKYHQTSPNATQIELSVFTARGQIMRNSDYKFSGGFERNVLCFPQKHTGGFEKWNRNAGRVDDSQTRPAEVQGARLSGWELSQRKVLPVGL